MIQSNKETRRHFFSIFFLLLLTVGKSQENGSFSSVNLVINIEFSDIFKMEDLILSPEHKGFRKTAILKKKVRPGMCFYKKVRTVFLQNVL